MPRRGACVFALLVVVVGCRRSSPLESPSDGARAPDDGATTIDRTASLLGGERGIDHVGIAVRDLETTTRTYHDVLGFDRPSEGRLPNGLRNVNYYFADGTYLETVVHWDREKAAWLAAFTDHHSGALFGVLSAFSPAATTVFLARRGVKVGAPFAGTLQTASDTTMPGERWKTFFLPDGQLPGDPLYFIAYPRAARDDFLGKLKDRGVRRGFYHQNTALGLAAIWVAVANLDVATRAYEAIGLVRGRVFSDPRLGALGQGFVAGGGEIWLLAPTSPYTKTAAFLRERGGPGIVGVTLLVGSVPEAARQLASRTGRAFPAYEGPLGNSILVPPELTHGVWMEFAQYLVPPATR